MAFLFYIDNQLTDQPMNDMELSTSIIRDRTLGSLLITQDVQLKYSATNDLAPGTVSGYTLIHNAFVLGQCTDLEIKILEKLSPILTQEVYTGVIKVPDISLDLEHIIVSLFITDNSYSSYISNNKSVEYNVQSVKTKNREDISPPQIYEVDVFNSATGVYGSSVGLYARGYRVVDVFRFLVAALSDNKIGFDSIYLQESPELFIFDGFALVNKNTDPSVKVSFAKLYNEIMKARNVSFYIDTTNPDSPIMRLESQSSQFSGLQLLEFTDIKEMIASITIDNIYGSIKVGASDNPGGLGSTYTFIAGTSYLGWMEETYSPLGQCNIDNELNLVSDFGITSNDVNDQINGAVNSDLDKLFLIECENLDDVLLTANAIAYPNWVDDVEPLYNQGLNNPSKLLIHGSNYQTGLTNTLQIGTNGFQASRAQDILIGTQQTGPPQYAFGFPGFEITPLVFVDETTGSNYDGGGNYGNTTGHYTIPIDGIYSFGVRLNLDVINMKSCANVPITIDSSPSSSGYPNGSYLTNIIWGARVRVHLSVYTDATLTTLVTETTSAVDFHNNGANILTNSFTVFAVTGHVVVVRTWVSIGRFAYGNPSQQGGGGQIFPPFQNPYIEQLNNQGWVIQVNGCGVTSGAHPAVYALENSIYFCNGSPDGGGTFTTNDPALYKNKLYEFSQYIPSTDWFQIRQNPTGMFRFEKDKITRMGWISSMKRNDWSGQTLIKLISNH